ncbi:cysteine--tRNA ligase [Candidatus Saccharibacteria bacterium]|nr:cysteine--tRNA ligase [Candidatus Saccharibacteria bacterium]
MTRSVESFEPVNSTELKLYTCGPTVYDYAHIGNLRAFVFNDTLRRTLESSGYKLKHVMNITDVGHLISDDDEGEDKLEKGAAREQKTVWEVADYYIDAFLDDVKQLNILEPNGYDGPHGKYARATDFISQQIELISVLMDKGFAYQTEQAIYFSVSRLDDYGKLTGQKLSDKEVGARAEVVTDSDKKHPQDFALWFFMIGRFANHSMAWDSPWGKGFPGWHLECSAIIHATLGESIDIHTGGVDHIGTHHTNEIAQTEAAFSVDLSKFWLHNEHLLVEGKKMSKSRGNFFTLKDLVDKNYEPLALRLLFLQAHYRSQMNFTWESLNGAQSFLKRLQAWADLKHQPATDRNNKVANTYKPALDNIKHSIKNDLNTSEALGWLSGLASASEEHGVDLSHLQSTLDEIDKIFGLELADREDITQQSKDLIGRREEARHAKDWIKSDELRQELLSNGVDIKDSVLGPIWIRT